MALEETSPIDLTEAQLGGRCALAPSTGVLNPGAMPAPISLLSRPRWAESPLKRALDVAIAGLLLLVLLPVLAVMACAVKLDSPGPVLFRQKRVGQGGVEIEILKFRTMREDRRKRSLPYTGPERRRTHKSPDDPRVTRVGRVLRRTCLDELPQLWNVLRGDMSVVGPRPELPHIVARYEPWQHLRHTVKPGITGWWQVNREHGHLMHERTELDLYYVEHQSFWLDVVILFRTVGAVVSGPGAF